MFTSTPLVRRSRRRSVVAVALTVTVALALTACGSDADDAADTAVTDERDGDTAGSAETTTTTTVVLAGGAGDSGTDTATTEAPSTTVAETTTTTTTTTSTTTTTTTVPNPGDCLVGQWRLRSQEFLDEIVTSLPAEATGGGLQEWTYVSGEYLIDFTADGTTRGQRLAWTHRLATTEGALITTIDSDDPGTYTVDGDMISVTDDASSATVTLGIEVGGVVQPLPIGGTQQVGTDAISGSGTFECDGDVLTIMLTDLPDAPPGGFTVTLDRT